MVLLKYSSSRMTWIISEINHRDGRKTLSRPTLFSPPSFPSSSSPYISHIEKESLPLQAPPPPPPPSSNSKISPAILFIIVILAVIFFISGLLHLIVRFLVKQHSSSSSTQSNSRYPREISGSEALQRQLQQLFHLHDSGLDQAFIDALPVFLYKEIVGPKEPFDCAVCLCEFSDDDKLRLLPVCSHAFHINCIDTWLLSNSTCPLCRGTLFVPGLAIENPIFDFEDSRVEEDLSGDREDGFSLPSQKPMELEEGTIAEKRVFSVRLGKFRNVNVGGDGALTAGVVGDGLITKNVRTEEGESSSSSLDARRCYSMGSYQYVVGDLNLQVALNNAARDREEKGVRRRGLNGNSAIEDSIDGKRLCERSRGESFSVSKIWQWSNKKGKIPISSDAVSLDGGLPWMGRRGGEQA